MSWQIGLGPKQKDQIFPSMVRLDRETTSNFDQAGPRPIVRSQGVLGLRPI
jgi:hypothetical protein